MGILCLTKNSDNAYSFLWGLVFFSEYNVLYISVVFLFSQRQRIQTTHTTFYEASFFLVNKESQWL